MIDAFQSDQIAGLAADARVRPRSLHDELVTVIRPESRLFEVPWGEIWRYRELVGLLVHRDYVAHYKQTLLGPLWHLLQPLLQALMFLVIFGHIARIPTDNIPPFLFYMSGLICWRYFSDCVSKTSSTLTANQHVFEKIYFPRLVVPIAQTLVSVIGFAMQLAVFALLFLWYWSQGAPIRITWEILLLPILLLELAAIGLGVGSLIAAATARYRDLAMTTGFFLQLWMYGSCVIFPLSQIPEQWQWLFLLNPLVPVIESFRHAALGIGAARWPLLSLVMVVSGAIAFFGIVALNHAQRTSVDSV